MIRAVNFYEDGNVSERIVQAILHNVKLGDILREFNI